MISYLAPLAAGNAIELLLAPPAGATRWRLLRKRTDTISAADDSGSNVVADGDDKKIVDRDSLINGETYYYRPFYWIGGAWVAAPSREVECRATFAGIAVDVLDIVRERVKAGFGVYVERGELQHPNEREIPVLLATPDYEGAPFPLVTVHLTSDGQDARFVGEQMGGDQFIAGIGDDVDEVIESEGWLSRYTISVVVWTTNGDQRNEMRKALKSIVLANLPVFESAGMSLVEPNFADIDDVNTYPVPMYQTACSITCVGPAAVARPYPVIKQVVFSEV